LAAGIPYVAGASVTEEACELLLTASRIEHGMMVEYLRVAFSANDPRIAQILARLAGEEFCHLVAIQNLRLMLDAQPNFARRAYGSSIFEPFPLRNDELSLDCLAKYVCCEAPPLNQVREDQRLAFAKARRSWSEAAPFVNRVGALYAKLYWLFMEDDHDVDTWLDLPVDLLGSDDAGRHVPEPMPAGFGRQLGPLEWPGALACVTRRQARAAILEVAGHGEGGPARPASHFEQLLEAYAIAEGAAPVRLEEKRAVPVEPTLDALYNLAISEVLLALALDPSGSGAEARRSLVALALDDWGCLQGLAGGGLRAAPHLELSAPTSGERAALCQGFAQAITALQRGLDSLHGPASSLRSSRWISDLRGNIAARHRLALQLRAIA
jgi:hypothetical protein